MPATNSSALSDPELLRRAVGNAKPNPGWPKFAAVMDVFSIDGIHAVKLCERFDFNPLEFTKNKRSPE